MRPIRCEAEVSISMHGNSDPMIGPDDLASYGILHASPVSHVIPGYPDRAGAHRGEEPEENDLDCQSHETAKATSDITNSERTAPNANRPSDHASVCDSNCDRSLGLPARWAGRRRVRVGEPSLA